nr:ferruginol synthase CYP1 [Scutellaria barbata]
MDLFTIFFVVFVGVGTTWFHFQKRRRSAKLPPGPYSIPIIGNILQLGTKPHQSLAKLSKIYGPLMSLQLGRIYTVVVTSPEIAKEILQKHDQAFSSRTIAAAAQVQDHHKVSMVYLPIGDEWRKIRKICREQMFSKHRLDASQGLRLDKLQKLRDYVQNCCENGRVVNIAEAALITTLNLMSATLFSIQVTDFDSESTQQFKKSMESLTNIVAAPNLGDFFPILKPLDLQGIQKKSEFYFAKMLGFIDDIINERLESRGSSSVKKNDFLETLLDLNQDQEYVFSINFIKHMLLDLFFAGSDTTASTAEWAVAELLLNSEKLRKAKDELKSVIGEKKQVEESDMAKLPYFQAVIKEVLRLHPAAPLLVPRKSDYDVQVSGYVIPKDAQIFVNVWAFSRDESVWSNPDSFEPERFLERKLDFWGRDFEFIPFGSGRRICPGLALADRMLPMLVATLIHNFDWKFEAGVVPELTDKFGLVLHKALPLKAIPIKP